MCKKSIAYFKKHALFNSGVHILIGIGIGIFITYPVAGIHPVRFGVAFLVLGLLGYLYPVLK